LTLQFFRFSVDPVAPKVVCKGNTSYVEDITGTGNNILTVCTQKGQVVVSPVLERLLLLLAIQLPRLSKIPPVITKLLPQRLPKFPKTL